MSDAPGSPLWTGGPPGGSPPVLGGPPNYHLPRPSFGRLAPPRSALSARPGAVPLRPLTFTDVLDGAIGIYRAALKPTAALVLVVLVPLQLFSAFLQRDALSLGFAGIIADPVTAQATLGGSNQDPWVVLLAIVSQGFVLPLLGAALVRLGADVAAGKTADPRSAGRDALGRAGRVLGAWWLRALMIVGPFLPGLLLILTGNLGAAALGGLLVLAAIVAVGVGYPLVALVTPCVIVEGLSPVAAIKRSIELVRSRYGFVLGTMLGTGLVYGILALIISGAPSIIGFVVGTGFGWVLVGIGSVLSQLVSAPLSASAAMLLHLDCRIRVEGLDLVTRAEELRTGAPSAPGAAR